MGCGGICVIILDLEIDARRSEGNTKQSHKAIKERSVKRGASSRCSSNSPVGSSKPRSIVVRVLEVAVEYRFSGHEKVPLWDQVNWAKRLALLVA